MIEFHKGNIYKAGSESLCMTQERITDMVGFLFFYLVMSVSSVFAEVLFIQALGKMWFLLYHWELPNLVASDEIHPEILQNSLRLHESHLQFSQNTWRMGDISENLGSL